MASSFLFKYIISKPLSLLGMHTNTHGHIIKYMANQKVCMINQKVRMMDDNLEKSLEDF